MHAATRGAYNYEKELTCTIVCLRERRERMSERAPVRELNGAKKINPRYYRIKLVFTRLNFNLRLNSSPQVKHE